MANPYGDTPVQEEVKKNPYGDMPAPVQDPREHTASYSQSGKSPGWMDTLKTLDFGRTAKNTPQSAAGVAEAALMPVYRPVETAEGMSDMAVMGIENFASNIPGFEDMPTPQKDQFKSYLSERYGTPEALKESIETDPMGMVVDAMGVLWGGKGVARMTQKMAADALPEKLPNKMVEENAKFPRKNLSKRELDELYEFMLQEKLDFSVEGIDKLDRIIQGTGAEVQRLIDKADTGQLIPARELNNTLEAMKRETLGSTPMGTKDRAIIDTVIKGWKNEIKASGKESLSLNDLQDFKQKTYGKIYWNETDSNKKNVRNAALKAQALHAKARLEAEVPGIHEANKRQGKALEIKPLLENSTTRIERNTGTMGQGLGTAQGAAWGAGLEGLNYSAGSPIPPGAIVPATTAIGATKGFMGGPGRKQSLAQAIYDSRRIDPNLVDIPLAKAMAIYLSRENQEQAR